MAKEPRPPRAPRTSRGSKRFYPEGASLTKQSDAADCDLNVIVQKYAPDQTLAAWNTRVGRYGDFSQVGEFQEMLYRVVEAQEHFDALPALVRGYCQNDPGVFLDLVHDPNRVGELRALGLLAPGEEAPQPGAIPPAGGPDAPPKPEQS